MISIYQSFANLAAVTLIMQLTYEPMPAMTEERRLPATCRQKNGQPFDLLIMDLTVPGGMGGTEALGHLRQLDP